MPKALLLHASSVFRFFSAAYFTIFLKKLYSFMFMHKTSTQVICVHGKQP